MLTVAEEPGQIGIRQSRFLQTGDVKAEEDQTLWWVSLGLRTDPKTGGPTSTALTIKEDTLRDVDETFYKINSNQVGFYRVNYPPARLIKLGAERAKLSAEDKIGLIADGAAMAIAGQGTTAGLLALAEQFKDESNKSYVTTKQTFACDWRRSGCGLRWLALWGIFAPYLQIMK